MSVDTDNFTYADGELEAVSSSVWEKWNSAFSNSGAKLNVVSNKVQNTGGLANSTYVFHTTYASENVYSQWVFDTLGAGWEMGGLVNWQDKGDNLEDGYELACYDNGGGTFREEIYKLTNHSGTLLGSSGTTAISAGDVGKITHETGDAIKAYLNGSVISGVGGTDSTYSDARVGIYMNAAANSAWRLDNWEGGDLGAAVAAAEPPRMRTLRGAGV